MKKFVCNGFCSTFAGAIFKKSLGKPSRKSNVKSWFLDGWKRCRKCDYFIQTHESVCKCCMGHYQTKPKVRRRNNVDNLQLARY